jgi:phenylacetate-coenzyme A ligase PaaK-like adenylate-forming protein
MNISEGGEVFTTYQNTDQTALSTYLITDSEKEKQEALLNTILDQASRSPFYKDNVHSDVTLDYLDTLPVTHYSAIKEAVDEVGRDGILLQPADYLFETSGSTGDPKRIPYSSADVDRVAEDYALVIGHVGVSRTDVGWNVGGAYPLVSGVVVDRAITKIPLDRSLSTMLTGDTDLIKAFKGACKVDRIDVMAAATLMYHLIHRACDDPAYIQDLVKGKLNRDYHFPKPLAAIIAKLYLRDVNLDKLRRLAADVRVGFSYAEPLAAYRGEIRKTFPRIKMVDVFGSTEWPLIAAQLDPSTEGLCLYFNSFIAEIARPEDLYPSEDEEARSVPGIPWWRWTKGMRGELLLSRPGECFPLVRYATGDMIEVLDPAYEANIQDAVDGTSVKAKFPLIKVLGRSVDVLDYEVEDERGDLMGLKVFSRQITDALQGAQNVRWWEVFVVEGTPAWMVFVVIPHKKPDDPEAFRKLLLNRLTNEINDPTHTIKVGDELGRFELLITPPEAYAVIQVEIDRRMSEGRPIGQLKPKRMHHVTEEQLQVALLLRDVQDESPYLARQSIGEIRGG